MATAERDRSRVGEGARRRDVLAEVRRAHAEYLRSEQELRLHRDHLSITGQLVELARLQYQSGRGTQEDVLRLALEMSRLHADVARIEQERRLARATLNVLMGRNPEAPLGPAVASAGTSSRKVKSAPPEIEVARADLRRSDAAVDRARAMARRPQIMAGVDYAYMPMIEGRHGYAAMLSISLPWFGGAGDELDRAERERRADERALEATRLRASLAVEQAAARLEGDEASFAVVDRDLLPQARRAFEAAQASFRTGSGNALGLLDMLRSYLQVEVERVRALARIAVGRAELDRARGLEELP